VLLKYVSSKSFGVFAVYRVMLGLVILTLIYTRQG
jgi:undecaprenyl pyrophosphate phosphatase UppP